jgi:peroxiredoxin
MERTQKLVVAALVIATALLTTQYVSALDEGARAPAFNLTTMDGERVTLADLRGKVVIVDFWASWCEPCGHAMPALDRLYSRYKGNGLVVVGVSVDQTERNARSFLRRTHVSFPVAHDADHAVAERYSPPTMPSTYVIDRRGVVRHVHAGFRSGDAQRLEQVVRGLL